MRAPTDEIISLAMAAIPPREIAARVGVHRETVCKTLTIARDLGFNIPKPVRGRPRSVGGDTRLYLSKEIWDAACIKAAALRRDPSEWARDTLAKAAQL